MNGRDNEVEGHRKVVAKLTEEGKRYNSPKKTRGKKKEDRGKKGRLTIGGRAEKKNWINSEKVQKWGGEL